MLLASEAAAAGSAWSRAGGSSRFGLAGVDPHRMLHGNPQACAKALGRRGLTWDDIAVIEVNEAFASVVLQFAHDAGLEDRWDDINPNGGGISLGHPLGATGARMTATLLNELDRRGERYGIAAMCVGFGMAIAGVVERLLSRPGCSSAAAARSRCLRRSSRRDPGARLVEAAERQPGEPRDPLRGGVAGGVRASWR